MTGKRTLPPVSRALVPCPLCESCAGCDGCHMVTPTRAAQLGVVLVLDEPGDEP